jgi:hypothetical protein
MTASPKSRVSSRMLLGNDSTCVAVYGTATDIS